MIKYFLSLFLATNVFAASLTPNTIGLQMTSVGANNVAKVRTRAVGSTVVAGGVAVSSSSGSFSLTGTTQTDVTNLSVTITTSGRPVAIGCQPDTSGTTGSGTVTFFNTGNFTNAHVDFWVVRGGTTISKPQVAFAQNLSPSFESLGVPCTFLNIIDFPTAGTYTYKIQVANGTATQSINFVNAQLTAYEL